MSELPLQKDADRALSINESAAVRRGATQYAHCSMVPNRSTCKSIDDASPGKTHSYAALLYQLRGRALT
jgi:hypothetical protein